MLFGLQHGLDDSTVREGVFSTHQVLGMLKAIEVAFETLPELMLQFSLLTRNDGALWSSQPLLLTMSITIFAAAILIVDAEATFNATPGTREWFEEYFGYLPATGRRRHAMLGMMVLFMMGYAPMIASALVAMSVLHPALTACVLVVPMVWQNVSRRCEGQWWCYGRSRGFAWNLFMHCGIPVVMLVAPAPAVRDPNGLGPNNYVVIVLYSFATAAGSSVAVLSMLPTHAVATLIRRICIPGAAVALMALTTLMALMEPPYRRTFYKRDPRPAMARRLWARQPDNPTGDNRRAVWLARHKRAARRHLPDLVRDWAERRHKTWERQRPAWFTPEWRDALAQVIEDGQDQSARARCTCVRARTTKQSHRYKVTDC